MQLKAGVRLRSVVSDTEVIVVRAPSTDVDLCCGGHAMVRLGTDAPAGLTIAEGADGDVLPGKRYEDPAVGIEVLCTKAGRGVLSLGNSPLSMKDTKPLPATD